MLDSSAAGFLPPWRRARRRQQFNTPTVGADQTALSRFRWAYRTIPAFAHAVALAGAFPGC